MFSPRAWRCFRVSSARELAERVFSTCVEVFLTITPAGTVANGFLHVRGGVSHAKERTAGVTPFSPRAWRCFLRRVRKGAEKRVFSTCVEVFLALERRNSLPRGFLHVRGGVSLNKPRRHNAGLVFSTCVEVFLTSATKTD